MAEKPAELGDASEKVFKYINITAENLSESSLKSVTMNITVNKSWLTENSIDFSDIVMYRYVGDKWEELETKLVYVLEKDVKYTVKTPGFSYFAIAKRRIGTIAEEAAEEEAVGQEDISGEPVKEAVPEDSEIGEQTESKKSNALLYAIGAIVLAAIVAAIIIRYRKPEETNSKKKK